MLKKKIVITQLMEHIDQRKKMMKKNIVLLTLLTFSCIADENTQTHPTSAPAMSAEAAKQFRQHLFQYFTIKLGARLAQSTMQRCVTNNTAHTTKLADYFASLMKPAFVQLKTLHEKPLTPETKAQISQITTDCLMKLNAAIDQFDAIYPHLDPSDSSCEKQIDEFFKTFEIKNNTTDRIQE